MKKIRIGNDFVFNWAIERGGLPEDLSSVLEAKLTASVFGKKQDVPFTVSGNIITIEFTPEICNIIGSYNLLFTYILPDLTLSDEDRKCAVDVDAFQIVAKTAQADDSTEFSMTSDMAIAFKGDKGDPFTYDDFTSDQIDELQRPATEAGEYAREQGDITKQIGINASLGEADRVINEDLRIQNETERINIFNSIKNDAVSVIESANNSASNANEKANFAQTQGDYAKEQGDYAKEQGEIAETFINNWIKNW